jgi:High potential iron-sulfur protein
MSNTNRRVFLIHAVAGTSALAAGTAALAQGDASAKPVKETDAYPKSMGFRLKTQDVDKAKFPRHDVSQKCSACQLYSGKEGDELGTCSFFKRQVPPEGWCRNFKPKKTA